MLDKYPDQVKLVVKHFPLQSHKYARKASKAALAANEQGKFLEFHRRLFENYNVLNDDKIQDIAKELDLDMEKFNKDTTSSVFQNLINRDVRNGKKIGVRGTPTIFINGKLLKNRSLQGFIRIIEMELKKKGS